MRSKVRAGILYASAFGLLASLGYALQHPFSKPLLSQFPSPLQAAAIGVIIAECVSIIVMLALMASSSRRKGFARLMRAPGGVQNLLILSVFSAVSLCVYLPAITMLNTVVVATILNMFPLYYVLISGSVEKRRVPPAVILIFLAAAAGIVASRAVLFELRELPMLVLQFLTISIVPIMYALSTVYQRKFFEDEEIFTYVVASSFVNAPVLLSGALTILAVTGFQLSSFRIEFLDLALFVTGALASGIVARYLLQRGSTGRFGRPHWASIWMFGIPVISGIVGEVMKRAGIAADVGFPKGSFIGIGILLCCVIALQLVDEK